MGLIRVFIATADVRAIGKFRPLSILEWRDFGKPKKRPKIKPFLYDKDATSPAGPDGWTYTFLR